jgi:N-sulfoglucosamine sulfohydrolase
MKAFNKLINLFAFTLIPVIAHCHDSFKNKPNIIVFLSDDHGADDTGYIGNKDVSTPVIDKFADEGMIFSKVFAPVSICAPSRSAIYTGLYPHKNGGHQQGCRINDGIKTLPGYLIDGGYRVALAGKTHIKPELAFPFEYIGLNDVSIFLKSVKEQPFCLIISYYTPHEPYFNKKNGVPFKQLTPKKWMPDTPETRKLTAASYDNVENLDNEVGTSLYWIEKADLPDNTIQIYTSDHGSGLPFCKWTLYEKGLHVPFVIKWDGVIEPGTKSDALVSLVDLLPTILEIADISIPEDLDGKSLMPIITEQAKKHHEYIFAAYTNLGVNEGNRYPIRSIRNERYKLIVNFNHQEPFSIRNTTRPDERSVICGYRVLQSWKEVSKNDSFAKERFYKFHNRPKFELYDLNNDPFELNNIADNEEYKKIQIELIEEMKKWLIDQNDVIIKVL